MSKPVLLRMAVLSLVAALASSATLVADTYPKNPAIDVLDYVFRLTLSDDADAVRGLATVDVRFREPGAREMTLDLVGVDPDAETGMTVRGVWIADGAGAPAAKATEPAAVARGHDAPFDHAGDRLRVTLAAPASADERVVVTIAYSGAPATGLIIGPNKHGDRTFFSDNWPNRARHWLPTVDHPYDKATSQMIVVAPSHYQVISNGLLVEETDRLDGTRLTHWKQSVPIATWLYALGAARFAVQHLGDVDGVPVQTWVYAQDRDAGFHDFAVPTKEAMHFYSEYVGPYAYEKLANVQSNSVGGGMEAATAIFYGDNSVTGNRDRRWRNVIIHEIAHQWFGNAVTEYDWDDVWLSEGFATYFTLLFIEHAYGREEFAAGLRASRDRVFDFYERDPEYRIVHDNLDDMSRVTTGNTYQKGGWTLHMLRGLIGTETFWRGIRDYYARYRDANASTDDFRRVMEEASGRDLEWFFDQWLYRGGALLLQGTWDHDTADGVVRIELAQVQPEDVVFRAPVQVRVEHADGSPPEIHTLEIDGRTGVFEIPASVEPSAITVDPEVWLLARASMERRR